MTTKSRRIEKRERTRCYGEMGKTFGDENSRMEHTANFGRSRYSMLLPRLSVRHGAWLAVMRWHAAQPP